MRIIFLDLDGVLNRGGMDEGQFLPEFVETFKEVAEKTGAEIVFSSSWKRNPQMVNYVSQNIAQIYDITPSIWVNDTTIQNIGPQYRGLEIQLWLEAHSEVTKYAILDDTAVVLKSQEPNLFRTVEGEWGKEGAWKATGLTKEIAEKVVKHFE